MTASSSSGATLRRLPAYWFALRPALLGSAGWFGVAVTLTAFAIDPAVPDSYGTPKEYALLLVSAAALLLWATRIRAGGVLRVTALEAILAASLIWGFVVNPHWVAQREGNWFWPPLAGLILTLIVRQLCHPTDREEPPVGEPGSRLIGVGDFMIALSIVGSALAIHGLFQAVSAGSLRPADGSAKTTVVSIFGTPNGFGAFMAAGIIAALTAATQASRRPVRVLLVGAALLQLVALLGNGSRGAMLGLFAAGLSVLLLRVLRRRKGRGVVIAALGVPIVLALGGVLLNRLDPGSGRARLMAWEISGAMLSDRPLTGVGTGKFSVEYGRYQSELWRHPEYAEFDRQAVARPHPNSELFHRLAEQGVPGGFLYVLLWASALGLLLRVLTRAPGVSTLDWGLLALLVAILLHSLVDSALQWVPTLLTAHIAMGLIPAPALLRVELQRARARKVAIAAAAAWAATVVIKTGWEYPGYQWWAKGVAGDRVARLELLKRAHRRLPSEPALNRALGAGLLQAGEPEQASRVLQQALDEQDGTNSRLTLAEAQLQAGWLGLAEVNARTAAARYPDRLRPRLMLARVHHAKGEDAQARAALASCIRRDTYYRSAPVDSVVKEAIALWRNWYDDDPPH